MNSRFLSSGYGILLSLCTFGATAQLPELIEVKPTASYLLVNNDPAAAGTVPIDLESRGISAGDLVGLTAIGSFFETHQSQIPENGMSGVFSSSSILLASNIFNRVPGAISAGKPYVSPPTYRGKVPTDIPEDFSIFTTNTTLRVPPGARYLFVAAKDDLYKDNVNNSNDPFRLLLARETETVLSVDVSSEDSSVHISWNSDSNQLYQLERSSSLNTGWSEAGLPVQGTGAMIEAVDAAPGEALFYRVKRVP